MADLPSHSSNSKKDAAMGDNRPSNACANRHAQRRIGSRGCAKLILGEGEGLRIIDHADRESSGARNRRSDRHVAPASR
jgi:hypothetical protein